MGRSIKTAVCKQCQKEFQHDRDETTRKFCSHSCAAKCNYRKHREKTPSQCHPDKPVCGKGLCRSCYYKKYRKDYPERQRVQKNRNFWRRTKKEFGVTPKQLYALWGIQDGKCPICLQEIPIYGPGVNDKECKVVIDHDHDTMRVRGLTCPPCNNSKIGSNTIETANRVASFLGGDFDARKLEFIDGDELRTWEEV